MDPRTITSVSRKRTFTGAIRRAIQVRDRHCQHPSGCDITADDCDVDHVIEYSDGGLTAQWNGRLGCQPHNRNPDKRDHDAHPLPERRVDRLEELRARIRWQLNTTNRTTMATTTPTRTRPDRATTATRARHPARQSVNS
jgi:5-methylcytosine-specific restriction endonuclease McrA